jgi:hypothetical protein
MKKKQAMGAHWNETSYSKLYQLYRRLRTSCAFGKTETERMGTDKGLHPRT